MCPEPHSAVVAFMSLEGFVRYLIHQFGAWELGLPVDPGTWIDWGTAREIVQYLCGR